MSAKLAPDALEAMFDLDYHLKNVDVIFSQAESGLLTVGIGRDEQTAGVLGLGNQRQRRRLKKALFRDTCQEVPQGAVYPKISHDPFQRPFL